MLTMSHLSLTASFEQHWSYIAL